MGEILDCLFRSFVSQGRVRADGIQVQVWLGAREALRVGHCGVGGTCLAVRESGCAVTDCGLCSGFRGFVLSGRVLRSLKV